MSGALERTLALYLQAIRLDPHEPAYPWNLASTLSRLGLNQIAFALIAQAIKVGGGTGHSGPLRVQAQRLLNEIPRRGGERCELALAKSLSRIR